MCTFCVPGSLGTRLVQVPVLQLYCNDTLARIARSYIVAYSRFVSNMEKKLAIVDHLIRAQHSCAQVQKLGYIYYKFQIACQCDGSNQPINQNCQNLAYLL